MSSTSTGPAPLAEPVPPAFQEFVNVRGRPGLFLFIDGEILTEGHVFAVEGATRAAQGDAIDLVIDSSGGEATAAFQVIQILRRRFKQVHACVPYWAKSAATLMCLGADQLSLGDIAQLGPLDTQITETLESGDLNTKSALDSFKTLEQLKSFSEDTFAEMVTRITSQSDMAMSEAMTHATAFVAATLSPLIQKLDAEKLGEYSRALSVGVEYGRRLLAASSKMADDQVEALLQQLVYGYPSHGFALGEAELRMLGLPVVGFTPPEMEAVRSLYEFIGADRPHLVTYVEPCGNPAADANEAATGQTTARPRDSAPDPAAGQ